MNWKRTKTILIFALLATNFLLIFAMYGTDMLPHTRRSHRNQKKNVLRILSSEGITFSADLSDEEKHLEDIRLSYETYENMGLIELLLGKSFKKEGNRFFVDDREIVIQNEQNLIYRKQYKKKDKREEETEKKAAKVAKKFLKEKGLDGPSVQFWKVVFEESGEFCVKYRQVENGRFMEDAHMNIFIQSNQVVGLDRKWFGSIVTLETYRSIEPPIRAAFRLIEQIDQNEEVVRPVEIESVELGYRLVSDILTIHFLEGEPTPYWRFQTSEGKALYVKAKDL